MKLSAYIALLESIRDSEGGDIEVFGTQGNGLSGLGLAGKRALAPPAVVELMKDGDGVVVIVDSGKFRQRPRSEYEEAGKGVRLD